MADNDSREILPEKPATVELTSRKAPEEVLKSIYQDDSLKSLCDVILEVEDKECHAHRAILGNISPVFKAMFTGGMKEAQCEKFPLRVPLPEVKYSMFRLLLDFVYLRKAIVPYSEALSLAEVAYRFQMIEVLTKLDTFLSEQVSEENFLELSHHAVLFELAELLSSIAAFAAKRYASINQWKEIPYGLLLGMLQEDALYSNPEGKLSCVLQWILADEIQRVNRAVVLLPLTTAHTSGITTFNMGAIGKALFRTSPNLFSPADE